MRNLASYIVVLVLVGGVVSASLGWKEWVQQNTDPNARDWRRKVTLGALLCLSAAALLLVGYLAHNLATGGDRNGSALTLLCIRSGNYLCLAAVLLSLCGRGRSRWAAMVGACFILFIWLSQGMSL